nr:hypothetical protein [Pedobacter panaciterrae]
MKTSTMFILAAVVATFIGLTAYNFSLKASFLKGDYKNPFNGLAFTSVKDVNEIDLQSANRITIRIQQGKTAGLWLRSRLKGNLVWTKNGNALKIDLTKEAKDNGFQIWDNELILVMPNAVKLTSRAYIKDKEEEKRARISGNINISGFEQDGMQLDLGKYTSAFLDKLKVGKLNALIGNKDKGDASLVLSSANQISTATFEIPGSGSLDLMDPNITKTHYTISDQATVSLNGKALQAIKADQVLAVK